MAAPVIYRSSDASAPALSGTAGSLVAVLDACLRTGYGSKAAAGWTKPFTATNKAVFRQGAGNSFYLDVDDSGAGTGGAKEALVRGYEAMTAVATGTNAFPTAAQVTNGIVARKSTTADAVARAWMVIADDRTLYLLVLSGDTAGTYQPIMFGDVYSLLTGDAYRTMIIGGTTQNTTSASRNLEAATNLTAVTAGHYLARVAAATGTSVQVAKAGVSTNGVNIAPIGTAALDGGLYISRVFVGDAAGNGQPRGWLRGFYQVVASPAALNDGDTATGTGDCAGRSFLAVRNIGGAAIPVLFETTAWDTSS